MKVVLLAMIVVFVTAATSEFQSDFLQGMETGFFLRDKPDGHLEYDCPNPIVNEERMNQINSVLGPLRIALGMVNNDMIDFMIESIELFANSFSKLAATTKNYPGSEFCSGVLFGMHGSLLLLKLAQAIAMQIDVVYFAIDSANRKVGKEFAPF